MTSRNWTQYVKSLILVIWSYQLKFGSQEVIVVPFGENFLSVTYGRHSRKFIVTLLEYDLSDVLIVSDIGSKKPRAAKVGLKRRQDFHAITTTHLWPTFLALGKKSLEAAT